MHRFLVLIFLVLGAPVTADALDEARAAYLDGKYDAALGVIEPAARGGDPVAQNLLADAYDTGKGKTQSAALAKEWFTKAAEQGFDQAQYSLGLFYLEGRDGEAPDAEKAVEWFDKAMAQGFPAAFYMRGRMMRAGQGGDANPAAASVLFLTALELGNAQAGNALADLYRLGEGVEADPVRAREIYARAAGLGYGTAMGNLALMYETGTGGTADPVAAFALYQEAVNLGDANAAINLAWFMIEQDGYWADRPLAHAYCIWGTANARPDQVEGFAESCGKIAQMLSEEERAESERIAASF